MINKIGKTAGFILVILLFLGIIISLVFVNSKNTALSEKDDKEEIKSFEFDSDKVIKIIEAEHLDKNRKLKNDIYEQVKELDGIWSRKISNEEYIRVKFEKNLSSSRDINIYSKRISGEPRIEVYEIDKNEKVAEFSNLKDDDYTQVILTGLREKQDSFDLRVFGGSIEIEHIIDPHSVLIVGNITSILCGDITGYDVVIVNDSGRLDICTSIGFVNITLGNSGNFTVLQGGWVNGTGAGAGGGLGNSTASGIGIQGTRGDTGIAGIASNATNGGGGGGGNRSVNSVAGAGGGGGFGGRGGNGGTSSHTTAASGAGGLTYGSAANITLVRGSGGGGGSGDTAISGSAGGGGFEVNAGTAGVIEIYGNITVIGSAGGTGNDGDTGTGGGGAGGHVILIGETINVSSAVINATGGLGGVVTGSATNDDCGGGGGGGGRIIFVYGTLENVSTRAEVNGQIGGANSCTVAPTAGSVGSVYWNSTIFLDTVNPKTFLLSPANGSSTTTNLTYFQARFTDNVNVSNATLFIYNSTGQVIGTNFTALGNKSIVINISYTLNYTGTFFWNYLAVDNSSNQAFNNTNFTLILSSSQSFTTNINQPLSINSGTIIETNYLRRNTGGLIANIIGGRSGKFFKTPVVTLILTNLVNRAKAILVNTAQSLNIFSEINTRLSRILSVNIAQSLNILDIINKIGTFNRILTQQVILIDQLSTKFIGIIRTTVDIFQNLIINPIINKLSSFNRGLTQNTLLTTLITRTKTITNSLTQNFVIKNSLARVLTSFRDQIQQFTIIQTISTKFIGIIRTTVNIIQNFIITPLIDTAGFFKRDLSQFIIINTITTRSKLSLTSLIQPINIITSFNRAYIRVRNPLAVLNINNILEKKSFFFRIIEALLRIFSVGRGPAVAEPEPEPPGPSPGGGEGGGSGGSGGGGVINEITDFNIDRDVIDIVLKQEERKREIIKITNKGVNQKFNITTEQIEEFVILSEQSFALSSSESKIINADFFAAEKESPGIRTGRIIISAGPLKKPISVILEIKEKIALFDVRSELLDTTITQAQNIKTRIELKNIGDIYKKVDVVLEYFIKDIEGNEIKLGEETVGVFGEVDVYREIQIPSSLKPGDYLFYVKLSYLDNIATSANRFTIITEPPLVSFIKKYIILILLLIILILLINKSRVKYASFKIINTLYVFYLRTKYKLVMLLLKYKINYLIAGIINKLKVLYLRIKYIPYLIRAEYKAGLFDDEIAAITHTPSNIAGTIKKYANKIYAKLLQIEYNLRMQAIIRKNFKKKRKNIFRILYLRTSHKLMRLLLKYKINYFADSIINKLYVLYSRIKYIPLLIKAKYKAGLYDYEIATIKHTPINIKGTIEKYADKIYARLLQAEYKLKMRNFKKQSSKRQNKKIKFKNLLKKGKLLYKNLQSKIKGIFHKNKD